MRGEHAAAKNPEICLDYGLYLIAGMLAHLERKLSDFKLPSFKLPWAEKEANPLLAAELRYDPAQELRMRDDMYGKLNNDQLSCLDEIVRAVDEDPQNAHFFLQGPGGTGKTFLYATLCHHYRAQSKVVLCVASSALLLPGGTTAHSRFCIPIDIHEQSLCNIRKNSPLADLLRKTALIIWDEVPMQHKFCFEAVHRSLCDVFSTDSVLFGGVPTLFGGDFAQILPVVRRGNRAEVVNACLQKSFLWPAFRVLHLRENMRVGSGEGNRAFADWLTRLAQENGPVTFPDGIRQYRKLKPFYDSVYPDEVLSRAEEDLDTFRDRAILTVHNLTANEINEYLLTKMPGEAKEYHSADQAEIGSSGDPPPPIELLHSFNPTSLPPSHLNLKVGAPVFLMRNLYAKEGLCNGTRMVITRTTSRCVQARTMGGDFHGQVKLIPRVTLNSTRDELPWIISRTQYPTKANRSTMLQSISASRLSPTANYMSPCPG